MKIAKRTLAIVMAMLMIVSTLAVAASAAGTLQAQIDAAHDGDVIVVNVKNAVETITINKKNITIDLNGNCLNSEYGQPAIIVKGGATVTIRNGHVESRFRQYSGTEDGLAAIFDLAEHAPSAIQASGAGTKVILDGVRAVGSFFRIPKQTSYYVPTGSALKLLNGAQGELHGAMLTGSYGVTGNGTVTIYDATLLGYLDAIKGTVTVNYDAQKVEKVNAADRIAGYLNSGVTLEAWELDLIKQIMDDRAYIYTVKPTDENAKLTIDLDKAYVTAEEIEHLYPGSDCSYKYVPKFAYIDENGSIGERLPLGQANKFDASKVAGKVVKVDYQLEFDLQQDIAKYFKNFYAYVDYAYDLAIKTADKAYAQLLDKYDDAVNELADLYLTIEEIGAKEVFGTTVAAYLGDTYWSIVADVVSLGGVKMYNAAMDKKNAKEGVNSYSHFSTTTVGAIFGNNAPAYELGEQIWGDIYFVKSIGTLDKVDAVVEKVKAAKGTGSFADQSKWADIAYVIAAEYRGILDNVLPELETRVHKLNQTISSGDVGDVLAELDISDLNYAKSLLKDGEQYIKDFNKAVREIEDQPTIAGYMDALEANLGDVKENVNKAIYVYNHREDYFTPENFIDGNFVKAYYLPGDVKTQYVLHLAIEGNGTINYGTEPTVVVSEATEVIFSEPFALNAVAETGSSFLGWKDGTTEQYVGQEPQYTANKSMILVAVFEEEEAEPNLYLYIEGAGTIGFDGDEVAAEATQGVAADAVTTLVARPADGSEFLYWMNKETGRVMSTNPRMEVETSILRYIEASFESLDKSALVLTNSSGTFIKKYVVEGAADSFTLANAKQPTLIGYDFKGWGPDAIQAGSAIDVSGLTGDGYKNGSSAFDAVGTTYNGNGYAFKINSTTENKYLVTPKFAIPATPTYSVMFNDQGKRIGNKALMFSYGVTYTAKGDNFSYWTNNAGQIVNLNKTYSYQVVGNNNVELKANYGKSNIPAAVTNIVRKVEDNEYVSFFIERSVASGKKVLSNGLVYSLDPSIMPKVEDATLGGEVQKVVSTVNTNNGIHTVSLDLAEVAAGAAVRSFVIVEGYDEPFYSDPIFLD